MARPGRSPIRPGRHLHRGGIGDVEPVDPGGPGGVVEPGTAEQLAQVVNVTVLMKARMWGCSAVHVLGEERLLDLRDQPLVGEVDAVDLDLRRLLVEQVVELLLGEGADRVVRGRRSLCEDAAVPAVHAVAGDRAACPRRAKIVVEERVRSKSVTEHEPSQRGHMPPG